MIYFYRTYIFVYNGWLITTNFLGFQRWDVFLKWIVGLFHIELFGLKLFFCLFVSKLWGGVFTEMDFKQIKNIELSYLKLYLKLSQTFFCNNWLPYLVFLIFLSTPHDKINSKLYCGLKFSYLFFVWYFSPEIYYGMTQLYKIYFLVWVKWLNIF